MAEPETTVVQYCCAAPYCEKIYYSRFTLKRHVEVTHMKKRQVTCSECGRTFATRQNLQEHMHLHSVLKAFRCETCGRRFRQGSQLSLHRRKHLVGEVEDSEQEQEVVTPHQSEASSDRLPLLPLLLTKPTKTRRRSAL
jgi:C4-type Zn-finger protein